MSRCWQVRATWPGGAQMTFGVQAGSYEAAAVKAARFTVVPGRTAPELAITRLLGRHHPARRAGGCREVPPQP